MKEALETLKEEITYMYYRMYYKYLDVKTGIKNLWKFRKIVYRDRWWDYSFMLDMIEFKLKDMEKHWGKDTSYVGDKFTAGRLKVILKDLEDYREFFDGDEFVNIKDYKKIKKERSKKMNRFWKNLPRFWD